MGFDALNILFVGFGNYYSCKTNDVFLVRYTFLIVSNNDHLYLVSNNDALHLVPRYVSSLVFVPTISPSFVSSGPASLWFVTCGDDTFSDDPPATPSDHSDPAFSLVFFCQHGECQMVMTDESNNFCSDSNMVMTDENNNVCHDLNDFNSIISFMIWDSVIYNYRFCTKPSLHIHKSFSSFYSVDNHDAIMHIIIHDKQ